MKFHITQVFLLSLFFLVLSSTFIQEVSAKNETGASITPQVQRTLISLFETAYIYNGGSQINNINYIKSKLFTLYPGNWLIGIISDITIYKLVNSTQIDSWWLQWSQPNRYILQWSYIMYRYLPGRDVFNVQQSPSSSFIFGSGFQSAEQSIVRNFQGYVRRTAGSDYEMYMKLFQSELNTYFPDQGYWNCWYFSSTNSQVITMPTQNSKWIRISLYSGSYPYYYLHVVVIYLS